MPLPVCVHFELLLLSPPNLQVTAADQKNQTEHISFQDIRNLQAHMPIHLCTSEREGSYWPVLQTPEDPLCGASHVCCVAACNQQTLLRASVWCSLQYTCAAWVRFTCGSLPAPARCARCPPSKHSIVLFCFSKASSRVDPRACPAVHRPHMCHPRLVLSIAHTLNCVFPLASLPPSHPRTPPGFGHYINEARASGAAVISTNHPPMNELITPRSGLLIDPERTASYKEQSLGEHADINAFLSPAQICSAVSKALHWTPLDLESKGLAARSDYLKEKDEFYGRAAGLKAMLTRRRQAAEEGQLESFNLSDGVQGRGREGQGSEDGSSTNERVGQQVQAQQRAKKNQHE